MNESGPVSRDHEHQRQALLLRALWRQGTDAALAGWLRPGPVGAARGLAAYRGNGEGLAARALAASHATVAQLMGDDSFAAMARAYWRLNPPEHGDMARYGASLADFIAADPQLADEPYLADVARLDWAVQGLETAADGEPPAGLEQLAGEAPEALRLRLRPGLAVLASRWPVVTIWQAHRDTGAARFAPVRQALAQGRAETALVWRDGWRPVVQALPPDQAAFMQALLQGRTLGVSLDHALSAAAAAGADGFDFEAWLLQALQGGWIAEVLPPASAGAPTAGRSTEAAA